MHLEQILILAKTYPVPSAKHEETTCVAGINENGQMRRLFPIQFRFIDGGKQFHKWQWISVKVKKAPKDHRMESHIVDPDSIDCGNLIPTKNSWVQRRRWIDFIPSYINLNDLEQARQKQNITLATIRPTKMLGLDITPEDNPDWTQEELNKLMKYENQGDLFRPPGNSKKILEKIPYGFHYRYLVKDKAGNELEQRHKIIDWEVSQLYRRCRHNYGERWEEYFRDKLEGEMFNKDLQLMMGTIHRFPDKWLIISLIYPPHKMPGAHEQRAFAF